MGKGKYTNNKGKVKGLEIVLNLLSFSWIRSVTPNVSRKF